MRIVFTFFRMKIIIAKPALLSFCRHSTVRELAIMVLMAYLSYMIAEVTRSKILKFDGMFYNFKQIGNAEGLLA